MPIQEHRLILRGIDCGRDVTVEYIKGFFRDLTLKLGMTLWKGPFAWEMNLRDKEPGISGYVAWHESGCQLHEYRSERRVTLDVYSCKEFKVTDVDLLFRFYFQPRAVLNCIPILNERNCR